jgi:hypothetical protein
MGFRAPFEDEASDEDFDFEEGWCALENLSVVALGML